MSFVMLSTPPTATSTRRGTAAIVLTEAEVPARYQAVEQIVPSIANIGVDGVKVARLYDVAETTVGRVANIVAATIQFGPAIPLTVGLDDLAIRAEDELRRDLLERLA